MMMSGLLCALLIAQPAPATSSSGSTATGTSAASPPVDAEPAKTFSPIEFPIVDVTKDNTVIEHSCRVRIAPGAVIEDADRNGVIHIARPDIVVVFMEGSVLRGSPAGSPGESIEGFGIRVLGASGVEIRSPHIQGYRGGILATGAHGLVIEGGSFSDLYRQRLHSTTKAEDSRDWLWPHKNDERQWLLNYGAAIYIEESSKAIVRDCTVRSSQNGILLSKVTGAQVYDNDASYLSGWGIGLWRSSRNVICRNAADYCIRGYSHGVYNRGQDSAGIIMFEQCSENIIAKNSATHSGDGLFGFAGREALGESTEMPKDFEHQDKGCNSNLIIENDFSHAAAHGIEMTFSKGNRLVRNKLHDCGICGFWGGYSSDTLIMGNDLATCGAPNASEGGGINIEHGRRNTIYENTFSANSRGIALWWDDDGKLLTSPWARANGHASEENRILGNTFRNEPLAIDLKKSKNTSVGRNEFAEVETQIKKDDESDVVTLEGDETNVEFDLPELKDLPGTKEPVGMRARNGGRESIVMTNQGPWDMMGPMVRLVEQSAAGDEYEIYRLPDRSTVDIESPDPNVPESQRAFGELKPSDRSLRPQVLLIESPGPGVYPYRLRVEGKGINELIEGTLVKCEWEARFFKLKEKELPTPNVFDELAATEGGVRVKLDRVDLKFGNAGPSELGLSDELTNAKLPRDWFGMTAATKLPMPAGRWRITTVTDDAVRVYVKVGDGPEKLVLENWKRNASVTDAADIEVTAVGPTGEAETKGATGKARAAARVDVTIRVQYAEMDGAAAFNFRLTPVP